MKSGALAKSLKNLSFRTKGEILNRHNILKLIRFLTSFEVGELTRLRMTDRLIPTFCNSSSLILNL
jgi:hypothetical protein